MSEINLRRMVEQLGLEELTINTTEIATNLLPAAITGFSDGDIVAVHPTYTGQQAELYGRHHYGEGRVAKAFIKAALENGMAPGDINDFQRFAADFFTNQQDRLLRTMPKAASVFIPKRYLLMAIL